jgi:hypothetical protein
MLAISPTSSIVKPALALSSSSSFVKPWSAEAVRERLDQPSSLREVSSTSPV